MSARPAAPRFVRGMKLVFGGFQFFFTYDYVRVRVVSSFKGRAFESFDSPRDYARAVDTSSVS